MSQQHTVRAYDQELNELRALISRMGGMAEAQIDAAVDALIKRDSEAAPEIVEKDKIIDDMEAEAEKLAIQTIALRAPMADDLRDIIAAMKISSILERTGDYAKNIAKRTVVLSQSERIDSVVIIPQMARMVTRMLQDVIDAFIERDAERVLLIRERDKEVDDLYNSLFRELLTHMMENSRTITPATHLLFIAKNLERVGDHATNIAEIIYYSVTGKTIDPARPKQDDTSYVDVQPPEDSE